MGLLRAFRSPLLHSSRFSGSQPRRQLIHADTIPSLSISDRRADEPASDGTTKHNPKKEVQYEGDYIRIHKGFLLSITVVGAMLYTILCIDRKYKRDAKEAREKLFNAHSDDEWLTAIKAAKQKEIDCDFGPGRNSAQAMRLKRGEIPTSKGEVIDHVESLTGKQRALLAAAITGEIETRYLGKERVYLSKEEREEIPLSERWEEEKAQSYLSEERNELSFTYGCVVM